jgi:hypothetical protein
MSHAIWFRAPMHCLDCGAMVDARSTRLHTSGLNPDPVDDFVEPGAELPLESGDFGAGYFVRREPAAPGEELLALEHWGCPVCGREQWALLRFERLDERRVRWLSAEPVRLTPELVQRVHYVSLTIDLWIKANPGPEASAIAALLHLGQR